MMEDASQIEAHSSRRTAAAMAAQASAMVPINSKSARKRTEGATKSAKQAKATEERRGSTSTNSSGQAKVSKAPATQPPPPLVDEYGRLPILQCHQTTDADETYGDQEQALSEFLKLHPMLSVTHTTLEQHTATVVVLSCCVLFKIARVDVAQDHAIHFRPRRSIGHPHAGAGDGAQVARRSIFEVKTLP